MCLSGISEQVLRGYTAQQLEQTLVEYKEIGGVFLRTPIMAEHATAGERAEGEIGQHHSSARRMHTFADIAYMTENSLGFNDCSAYWIKQSRMWNSGGRAAKTGGDGGRAVARSGGGHARAHPRLQPVR